MDLKKITKDRWIGFATTLFIGVWSFLTLSFPILQMNITNLLTYKECGFDLFDFNSIFMSDANQMFCIILGIVMLVQFELSIALIVFAILSLFDKEYTDTSKTLMIYCYIFIFIYMVFGIVFSLVYKDSQHWLDAKNGNLGSLDESTTSIFTLSYIPFIIASLALLAYWLYNLLSYKQKTHSQQSDGETLNQTSTIEQKVDQSKSQTIPQKNEQDNSSQNSIELLKSYKELLDNGVITQQEFDELKKRILKL